MRITEKLGAAMMTFVVVVGFLGMCLAVPLFAIIGLLEVFGLLGLVTVSGVAFLLLCIAVTLRVLSDTDYLTKE